MLSKTDVSSETGTGCVVTQCNHIFHRHCLRRWLVLQDNCPLCTQPAVKQEELAESEVDTEDEAGPPPPDNLSPDEESEVQNKNEEQNQSLPGLPSALEPEAATVNELRQRHVVVNDLFDGD